MSASADRPESQTPPLGVCGNCGTELLGPHCYHCGQPIKGLVRHFSSIVGDFLDSVFELDGRIWTTLPPLLLRPGHLSLEYFAGRRVRYVSPVRLMVFMSLLAFFLAQFALDFEGSGPTSEWSIAEAQTAAEVEQARDRALAELARARTDADAVPAAEIGLAAAERAIEQAAQQRLAELNGAADGGDPTATDQPPPGRPSISFGSGAWHPVNNPIRIGWLGPTLNDWLNRQVGRAQDNIARVQDDPNLLKDALLGALPATLLVLLPLFAVLLKLAYLFKRRLYMEHLIVALHSHAFLCLALLIATACDLLSDLATWLGGLRHIETLVFIWVPIYLLLMQKRIYQQGWLMTLLKYLVIGNIYLVMLSFALVGAVLTSLVNL